MSHMALYRVRWFKETRSHDVPGDADLEATARIVLAGNPTLAVTIETEGGEGPILLVDVGGSGEAHRTDYWGDDLDRSRLIARIWEVDDAAEEVSALDTPAFLLGEFADALWEDGVKGVRLIVAEETDEKGRPVVLGARWYDWEEVNARMMEYDEG